MVTADSTLDLDVRAASIGLIEIDVRIFRQHSRDTDDLPLQNTWSVRVPRSFSVSLLMTFARTCLNGSWN